MQTRPVWVVFGEDWGAHPSSSQHLLAAMLDDCDVVWVNSIGLRRPGLCWRDLRRMAAKLWAMLRPGHGAATTKTAAIPQGMQVLAPRCLPWPGGPGWLRRLNRKLLQQQIETALHQHRHQPRLLWIALPTAVDLVGQLHEAGSVYYCGDDFAALAGVDHVPVQRLEAELVQRVDKILAASAVLTARFPKDKTRLLPHGVDLELFARPAARPHDLPDDRPCAGFYGSLASWLDVDLLAGLAQGLPDWRFDLIGPIKTDVRILQACPNIRLLGPRPHTALAAYVQHWNAALLPFRDNAQIRACNPLKLREYLASGTPVVSTDFPALAAYRRWVHVVDDAAQAVQCLGKLTTPPPAAVRQRQQRCVAEESWQARTKPIRAWMAAVCH